VAISIAGRKHRLWRAVDQDGYVLDEIVQSRRNTKAAKRLLTQLIKKQAMAPKRIITDKLPSMGGIAESSRDPTLSPFEGLRALMLERAILIIGMTCEECHPLA
jgi:transposase-like protein